MASQYMFVAGGDACENCAGLAGTVSDEPLGPQHDNCQCQDVPVNKKRDDCPTLDLDVEVLTEGSSVTIIGTITVTCCDGSENQESVEVDLGERSSSPSAREVFEALHSTALELTPPECSEGDDDDNDDDVDGAFA